MTDCLIIGFNDSNFAEYVKLVESMGKDSGAYRDLRLAFITHNDAPYRALDILTHFQPAGDTYYHNAAFLWPTITYLGSYLSKRRFTFDYVNLFQLEKDTLRSKLQQDDILTIAISTTLYVSADPIKEIIDFIRQYNTTAKIIVGGPYIANKLQTVHDPAGVQDVLRYLGADLYVISNEGEHALVNILRALKSDAPLAPIANIAYADAGSYVLTATAAEANSLEENMVDYRLFPRQDIGQFLSLRTAKSCPFACAFCAFPTRAGKYTYLSVDMVEQELNAIQKLGSATTLTFLDDTFNVPKKRFHDILEMMIRNNYGFKWNSFFRSDHGDDETIALMADAGCEGVFLGIESGSDTMLEHMRKTSRTKDYRRAIARFKEVGIIAHCNFIIGFPGETYQTVQETIDFIEEVGPDYYRAQLWYADPVTPVWEQRVPYGIKGLAFNWSHNTMDSRIATDLVDKMFLAIDNSTWLPQWGFEQWSLFYLQRHGMSRDRIKTFVQTFNAVIKDKLLYSDQKPVPASLLQSLRDVSQIAAPLEAPDTRLLEPYRGARYAAAERFWTGEFGATESGSSIATLKSSGEDKGWASQPCAVDSTTLATLAADHDAGLSEIILAAFAVLLAQLNDHEDVVLVAAVEGAAQQPGVVPMRLSPAATLSFRELIQITSHKYQQALEHQLFAFHLLTNPLRLAVLDCRPPHFEVGYLYSERPEQAPDAAFADRLPYHPTVSESIGLVLQVTADAADVQLQLSYRRRWFAAATVEGVASCLSTLLQTLSQSPDSPLAIAMRPPADLTAHHVVEADAREVFNF